MLCTVCLRCILYISSYFFLSLRVQFVVLCVQLPLWAVVVVIIFFFLLFFIRSVFCFHCVVCAELAICVLDRPLYLYVFIISERKRNAIKSSWEFHWLKWEPRWRQSVVCQARYENAFSVVLNGGFWYVFCTPYILRARTHRVHFIQEREKNLVSDADACRLIVFIVTFVHSDRAHRRQHDNDYDDDDQYHCVVVRTIRQYFSFAQLTIRTKNYSHFIVLKCFIKIMFASVRLPSNYEFYGGFHHCFVRLNQ